MRKSVFSGALCLTLLAFAGTAFAVQVKVAGFVAPREKIELPYTNDKCIKNCHGEKELFAGGDHGKKRDLTVELEGYEASVHGQRGFWCIDCHFGADPNFHPREGYPKVDCRACHSEKPPENVYPPNPKAIFAERETKPPEKKYLKGDGWTNTKHGKAWLEGKEKAPFCNDCHTAHYVKRPEDSASTVSDCNLPDTCGKCHEGKVASVSVGGALARWSIAGHGKGDFSQSFSEKRCVSCHQGEAAHGEETVTGQACPSCHRSAQSVEAGSKSFHVDVSDSAELSGKALRYVYDLLFWGGVVGMALAALFFGVTSIYRKNGGE